MNKKQLKRWAAAGLIGAALVALPFYGPSAVDLAKGGTAMAANQTSGMAAPAPAPASVAEATVRTISVAGQGTLTVQPDVAYASFGLNTKAETANEAQAANAKVFAEIEKVLKEQFQVASKDIKTSGFNVYPEYDYSEAGRSKIIGYSANHTITVTYRDLDGLGALLDAVSKAGANRVNGVQFATEKSEAYELQAIEKAMANAKAKADVIAKAAGRTVKGVLHVQQGAVSGGNIIYPVARMESMAVMDAGASTSLQPGELEFTTTVSVTYEM